MLLYKHQILLDKKADIMKVSVLMGHSSFIPGYTTAAIKMMKAIITITTAPIVIISFRLFRVGLY